MKMIQKPSPNHDSRGGVGIDMLVLHYTGMQTGVQALARLCEAESKVSAHYLVEENGDVYQLVDEPKRAWHAGVASWRGQSNINARSIGIEIVNLGHEWGYAPFPQAQMRSVQALCLEILARYPAILPRNVVGHSDVAPARKQDPGELFDWAGLAQQGIGLWPQAEQGLPNEPCEADLAQLSAYGYSAEDARPEQLITAFQRHFRPTLLNGEWDSDCEARLQSLLAQI